MVRKLASARRLPRPVAVLLSLALAVFFVPFTLASNASAATTGDFSYKLEGCRLQANETLPNASGKFICPDADYTTGNLGKSWNELDLVPHRLTLTGQGATDVIIAADREDAGHPGYDVLSAPVINGPKSTPACSVTVGAESIESPGQGGADQTIYRLLHVSSSTASSTCVLDYYQRLALGSHLYPGSSLHSNLLNDQFGTGTVGSKEVSIPVKEISPQELSKTMTATQGTTYNWNISKSASPTSVNFANTCAGADTAKSAPVTFTVNWSRSAATGDGDVLLTTNITATNPAHRVITVSVTDKMYAGSTQTTLLATNTGAHDVPAGVTDAQGNDSPGTYTFTFSTSVPSSASSFNDVATATYTDKATGIAVPGTTTATASANLASNGQTTGATATISDTESISGAGFSYSVDGVNVAGGSPNAGSFTGGYVLGTKTTGSVGWSSGTIAPAGTGAASGSYTFSKTVYVAAGTVGSGTLSDSATLTPAGKSAVGPATASVSLSADAANPTLRIQKVVDIAPETDATFTFKVRAKDANGDPTGPEYAFSVTILAGQTSGFSAFQTVAPSAFGYHYTETAASGYTGVDGDIQALAKCDTKTQVVNNTRDKGRITVHKTMQGDPSKAGTTFTVHVDCPGTTYDQDVVLNQANSWTGKTGDIPTGTQCSLSEDPVAGWDLVSITPNPVTVGLGDSASVEVVNQRQTGSVSVHKVMVGDVAGASTTFTVTLDCDVDAYDRTLTLDSGNSWTNGESGIPTGVVCSVSEPTVPAGWDPAAVTVSPSGSFTIQNDQTVSVTVTNHRQLGHVSILKVMSGDVAGASTDFTVHLDCTPEGYDQDIALNAGNSWTAGRDLPTGISCTVTEPSVPAGWVLESVSPAGSFVVSAAESVQVTVTNERLTGSVTIKKTVVGDVAGASTDFTAHLDCTPEGYDQDVALNQGNSWTATVNGLPSGISCTVTEPTVPSGWTLQGIDPSGSFVIGAGQTVSVEVTNERVLTGVTFHKVMQGDVAGASTSFTLHLNCSPEGYDQDVVLDAANNWTKAVSLPTGLGCDVTEAATPGWHLVSIDPSHFTVGTDLIDVTATNARDMGDVTLTKTIEGPVAGAGTDFTAHLDCDVDAYDQDVTLNAGNNWTETVSMPTGVSCDVTETDIPAGWSLKSITPEHFTVTGTGEDAVQVAIVNTRDMGDVTITKVLDGPVAGAGTDFTAHLDCDVDAYDQDVALNEGNDWTATVSMPTGVSCDVTETSIPAGWLLESITPAHVTVTGTGESAVQVDIVNLRDMGMVEITKSFAGNAPTDGTTFTVHVDCDVNAYDQDVTLGADQDWTADLEIPTGVSCDVTETNLPEDWALVSITPSHFTVTSVDVETGQGVVFVDVVNRLLTGGLTISKAVSPVAGNGVVVNFGDTLTYTLTVNATGEIDQPDVVVTDYVPGHDPARPTSGSTTYVAGSAACSGACTVDQPGADGLITWHLGLMPKGTTRTVTFKVTIDTPAANADGSIPAVDILNAGAVQSAKTPKTPSNEVKTPVSAVLPEKLPRTGAALPIGPSVGGGVGLLMLGLLLMAAARRRDEGRHRA